MCTAMCTKPCGGRALRVTTLPCPAVHGKDTVGESGSQGRLGRAGPALVGVASQRCCQAETGLSDRVILELSGVGIW